MRTLCLVALSGLAASAMAQPEAHRAVGEITRYDGHKVVRIEPRRVADLRIATAFSDDVWTETIRAGRPVDLRMTPEQFAAFSESGVPFRIVVEDVQRLIDAETAQIIAAGAGDGTWYDTFHNYADHKTYCQALATAHPALCEFIVLGQSVQGRDIFGLRITGPGSTANRPASLWWGGQHAREWATVAIPEYCAEELLTSYATDPDIKRLVDTTEFYLVPIMNPDGYEYTWTNTRLWRKNRRNNAGSGTGCNNFGVDLNRNWGHQWGGTGSSGSCSSDTYRGPSPFSEPETRAIRDLVLANPRILTTMDWHSFGQLVMSPWGYTNTLPTPAAMAQEFQANDDAMAAAILSVHGREYTAGPIGPTLYLAAGCSVDWAWGAAGVKGFTIEVRDQGGQTGYGFVLPPEEILPIAEENFAALMALARTIAPCYANCDGSTVSPILNISDFACFLNSFAAGGSYANCDGSTVSPVLNISDFACFLNAFAAGCP
jgi:murein tripeptide amidase MpaA